MCGRMTLTRKDFRQLAHELDAAFDEAVVPLYRPRYNIAPTDQHWILRTKREQRQLLPAKFGLVNSWAKDAKGAARQINARAETVATARAFREAIEKRRCAVPVDGFFEWIGGKEARRPIWFHDPGGGLLLLAGVYESWRNPQTGDWDRTFAVITTGANALMAPVHDRMPVLLPPDRLDDWLHVPAQHPDAYAGRLHDILNPPPEEALVATEVSRRANSVHNDDPGCLTPLDSDASLKISPRLL